MALADGVAVGVGVGSADRDVVTTGATVAGADEELVSGATLA